MAQIQKGDTFVDGQQVTASRLNQFLDSATVLPNIITDQTNIATNEVASNDTMLVYDNSATALREATASDLLNSNIPITASSVTTSSITTSSITGGAGINLVITPASTYKVDVAGAFEAESANVIGNATIGGTLLVTGNVTANGTTKANLTTDSTAITQTNSDSSTKIATTQFVQDVKTTIVTQTLKRWLIGFPLEKNYVGGNAGPYSEIGGRACSYSQTGTTLVLTNTAFPFYFTYHLGGEVPMSGATDVVAGDKVYLDTFTGGATAGIYTVVSRTSTTLTVTSSVSVTASGTCRYRAYLGNSLNGITAMYVTGITKGYIPNNDGGNDTTYTYNIFASWSSVSDGYVYYTPSITPLVQTELTKSISFYNGTSISGVYNLIVL